MLPHLPLPGGRWHLFEICDLPLPPFLQSALQETLTTQWTTRLPYLQTVPPATHAAKLVAELLTSLTSTSGPNWKVIDFCSGSGGPTPFIELTVNDARRRAGHKEVDFLLSDLYPSLDAWILHASRSENLTFIPNSVNAANPPFAAISPTTPGDKKLAKEAGFVHDDAKVMRLFCLAFHHFDDEIARKVLKSTMETSDAVVVLELQERSLLSLAAMCGEFFLVMLMTIWWFPLSWETLPRWLFTYWIPIIPFIHAHDGFVSCLRTRTFREFVNLIDDVMGRSRDAEIQGVGVTVRRGDWSLAERSKHP
ncbi:hypothetical protein B0A48_02456 [Cryoendolithus antarcticus]|uniref:Uncharacterized protein n=1 Tax=Cryoendolithus antarcticus TaxID=1507870 RepID=A0A1V8TP57_9PEZI|nr:hypothetical protein B0A48_02456 [Cryoendolithus antarcticus]